jgi:hypothetical protein
MADTRALGARAARRESSNLSFRTKQRAGSSDGVEHVVTNHGVGGSSPS